MSNKQQTDNQRGGFTIIEVVLVLAIAGLIFLMVFVALPALQRSQRDTRKREDVSRVASALTQYQTNNNGNLPTKSDGTVKKCAKTGSPSWLTSAGEFRESYLENGTQFKNPQNTRYNIGICVMQSDSAYNKTSLDNYLQYIFILTNAKCDNEEPKYSAGSRNYAIVTKLEGGGYYCLDNS